MPPSKLPVPNSTTSFWRSNPHRLLDNYRSTPDLPTQPVDIAVIGAGFAGISTVYHVLDICKSKGIPTPSILILDARQVSSGATGRNGGHLKPDPYNRPSSLAVTHGVEVAAEVARFEAQNLPAVKKVVEEEGIECDFVLTRAVDALMTEDICERMRAGAEMLRKHGVEVMDDVYFAKGAEAEQLSGVKGAKGCLSYSAGHLFPYKLIIGLLSKALAAGVNLQTNTPVTGVTEADKTDSNNNNNDNNNGDNGPHEEDRLITLTTPRGSVRARNVVYATNGYTSSILAEFAGKIVPVRGICSHIEPANNNDKTRFLLLPHSYIIRWSDTEYEYLIPRLDGGIVVGGARSEYYHELQEWYDNVNDDALIESAKTYFDGYMQRTFRGWEDSGARTSRVWTGIMGYSTDSTPHVGVVPGRRNQFILAGFSGHGMPNIFLSAKGVASMMMEDATFNSTGIPRIYEATQARLDSPRNNVLDAWKARQKERGAKLRI